MSPAEYKALPANLQRDVRVALACGYGWKQIEKMDCHIYVEQNGCIDKVWQPTTDPTIWTALMGVKDENGDRMRLTDSLHQNDSWIASYFYGNTIHARTQGEAVCACFVAADPLGHLGKAGV